jgi:NarL family two-component system response regulator LiaR
VKKTVLLYGLLGGVLIAALKFGEYRFLVVERSLQIYGAIVAILFALLGIWLGRKLSEPRAPVAASVVVKEVPVHVTPPFVKNTAQQEQLGITPRELEVLELLAAGLSNREIAERLCVSQNTVKTHSGRLYGKLSARRRTQAVQHAKQAGLIP